MDGIVTGQTNIESEYTIQINKMCNMVQGELHVKIDLKLTKSFSVKSASDAKHLSNGSFCRSGVYRRN